MTHLPRKPTLAWIHLPSEALISEHSCCWRVCVCAQLWLQLAACSAEEGLQLRSQDNRRRGLLTI